MAAAAALRRVPQRTGHYERQAAFIEWVAGMFTRAGNQGILLESLTESELEWIGRM
jgi:hypothetical protein